MLQIEFTTQFKKDYLLTLKRGYNPQKLMEVISMLQREIMLSPEYRDHKLQGQYSGYRECHIAPDWLLIYRVKQEVLTLVLSRTGSHSDLF